MTFKIQLILISIFVLGFLTTTAASAYEFVTCPGDNNTYPTGTVCEFTDDNLMEDEELEDEQQHQKESDEYDDGR